MQISSEAWAKYQRAHAMLQGEARRLLDEYFDSLSWDEDEERCLALLAQRAVELFNHYGLADATLSAAFYDEVMELQGANVPQAWVRTPNPEFVEQDVRDAVARATSRETAKSMSSGALSGHVKRAGVDTMRANAVRDHAMWAWVCIGDSCAFCRTLGSNGWQQASKAVLAGNHAEHIHDNCDCQFVVKKPGETLDIDGYDPDALRREYEEAGGKSSKDIINSMRRADYTPEYAEQRNARRRELYAENVSSEKKAQRAQRITQEKERRRVAALSDEAKVVFGSESFVETFGTATASSMESAIDGAMKSGDARRANAAKLLSEDIRDGFEVDSVTAEESKYLTGIGKVQFSPVGAQSPRTIAHELAHRRDDLSALSYTARKVGRDGMVDVTLTTSAGSWSTMSFEHSNKTLASRFKANRSGVTPAWRDLKKRLDVKSDVEAKARLDELRRHAGLSRDDARSLSDIIHAASNGEVSLGYSHPVSYWSDTTRVIETWADYNASLVANGSEAALIQQLFPDEAATMDAMMEVMIQ